MTPWTFTEALRLLAIAFGAFVVMGLVYSLWKFEQLSRAARARSDQPMGKRTTLVLRIATRLGLGRAREGAFCVVLVEAAEAAGGPPVGAKRLAATLKPLVRDHVDEVAEMDECRVGMMIGCEPGVLAGLCERWRRVSSLVLRAGAAGYPVSATGSEALLKKAEEAFDAASLAGRSLVFHPEESARLAADGSAQDVADPRIVDPLTGLLRSERVGSAALKFMARWRREGWPVALVLLKFDDLDAVAERYGADARDESLRNLGRVLSTSVREQDVIGRIDEDEFLILAALREGDGLPIARRVLDRFSHLRAQRGAAPVRGTVSAGVGLAPEDAREFSGVLKCARTALYSGQRAGRSRCTKYSAAMPAERRRLDDTPRDRF